MAASRTDVWARSRPYESFIGRWSREVAPWFLDWLPRRSGAVWCDVGCGTGALSHAVLAAHAPAQVIGLDPSEAFLAAARVDDARLVLAAATATALPLPDSAVDRVVSALVLNFVPSPPDALREMRRVARSDGVVAAYVWDYAEGMQLLRSFWDAAIAEDPGAADLDEGQRFRLCRPEPLHALFSAAGLDDVEVTAIEIPTRFTDFDDLWAPFLGGQGPAPGYVASLPTERREELRGRLRSRMPIAPSGAIDLTARVWAVRGTVPREA